MRLQLETDFSTVAGHLQTRTLFERDLYLLPFTIVGSPISDPLHSINIIVVCVQLGNVISANIYLASDKPLYHAGNTHLIVINVLVIFVFLFTKVYYVTRNRLRDKKWNAMSTEVSHLYLLLLSGTNQRLKLIIYHRRKTTIVPLP